MQFRHLLLATFIATILITACSKPANDYSKEATLNTLVDSVSYTLGFQSGDRLSSQSFSDVDVENYIAGFISGLDKDDSIIPDSEIQPLFTKFSKYITDKMLFENKEEGRVFLAENILREGVMETPSGLQYEILEEGTGASPTPQDSVVVQYEGSLIDGTVFDGSYINGIPGEPVEFLLGGVIPGWIEGLELMKEGATYMFYLPSDLAYGENPRPGGPIQPNDALIFKIKLVEVR